jgi:hypothetical protein
MNVYDRESVEFCAVDVKVNDVAADPAAVQAAITTFAVRPALADWSAPTVLGDQIGVMVDGPALGVGEYEVWVKVDANPETVVLKCDGGIRIA